MVNTILKEADLFCPNSVRINFTIYHLAAFKNQISEMISELHQISPAKGYDQVYLPGERSQIRYNKAMKNGIEVATDIYDYLKSDTVHLNMYDGKGAFA